MMRDFMDAISNMLGEGVGLATALHPDQIADAISDAARGFHFDVQGSAMIANDRGVKHGIELTVTTAVQNGDSDARRFLQALARRESIAFAADGNTGNGNPRFKMSLAGQPIGSVSYGQGMIYFDVVVQED